MSRFLSISAFFILFLSPHLFGQQDFSKVKIASKKLGKNIYTLKGAGGNIGVLTGKDGVILIDDQFAPLHEKIARALGKISKQKVKFVINTHWHFDHVGGNEKFGKTGSIIVAHKNVRKRMKKGQLIEFFKRQVPPAAPSALPVVTFEQEMNLHLNGEDIQIIHVRKAHTDGDSIVFFKKSREYNCKFQHCWLYV